MAIVYFHRRKDTNEVFYVGIGDKKYRATDKHGRNHYWWDIVKNVGYTIEIVHSDIDYEEAMDLEIKYIKQFGRKDLGLGNLVNLTDGGNVMTGYNHKEETKEKISESNIGKTFTKKHIENLKKNHKGLTGKNHSQETKDKMSITQKKIWNDKDKLIRANKSNKFRKLTEENVIEAIELYNSNKMSYHQLAKKYNVAHSTIRRAVIGETWKYLHL